MQHSQAYLANRLFFMYIVSSFKIVVTCVGPIIVQARVMKHPINATRRYHVILNAYAIMSSGPGLGLPHVQSDIDST